MKSDLNRWLCLALLIAVLAAGAYLRVVGMDWDEEQHLHPDERFLTMVESSLVPVDSLTAYFDTATSTLNPNNQGHGFFVYGTLPIFMVRYLAEWIGNTGYGSVYLVGRALSALMDLLCVVLVYFIGARLFNRKAGLIGAAFSTMAVLQIQQSHFFTVDTFITFFTLLAFYFAVEISTAPEGKIDLVSYLLFGVSLGMAVASKVSAVPVALTLPLAAWIQWMRMNEEGKSQLYPRIFFYLVLAALTSLLTFRVFQPYAFSGPGFFNFRLNEAWVAGLKSLQAQASGDVDFPPALQWARRPVWFSFKNMVLWGLGLPFGILAWSGFIWQGWKLFFRRFWRPELVLWAWTALYFAWQSIQWNSTMRYQLPIYPLLAVFTGWLLVELWKELSARELKFTGFKISGRTLGTGVLVVGCLAWALTALWAFSFSRIYTTPHPRVAATRWILDNIPGPATLEVDTDEGEQLELLSYPEGFWFSQGECPRQGFLYLTMLNFRLEKPISSTWLCWTQGLQSAWEELELPMRAPGMTVCRCG
ncbi:MAG: phospholipid carrier-dependent glycosyltransferase [Anaerolineales bacterium]